MMADGTAPDGDAGAVPDVVYLYLAAGGDELRWSLRSLSNLPHGQVFVVGDRPPDWATGVVHVPREQQGRSKYDIQRRHILEVCDRSDVGDRFVLFNDDFFVVEPVDRVPVWHRGPIVKAHRRAGSGWLRGIDQTRRLAEQAGVAEPLSYELHVPLPMVKADAGRLLSDIGDPHENFAVQARSLYGNLAGIGGVFHDDVKVGDSQRRLWSVGGAFVSTSNRSFRSGHVGRDIQALFPDPGPYERGGPL